MKTALAGLAMAACLASAHAGAKDAQDTEELVQFRTTAQVEIDAAGKVVSVKPDERLPAPFAEAIRGRLAQLAFVPPLKAESPVGGLTWVKLSGCVAPAGKDVRLALKYLDNGPRQLSGARTPPYPVDALRRGSEGTFDVTYRVGADGKAIVEAIEPREDSRRSLKDFRGAITEWIAGMAFTAEQVDGEPVATRLTTWVEYRANDTRRPGDATRAATCQAALANPEPERTAVVDSRFALVPGMADAL